MRRKQLLFTRLSDPFLSANAGGSENDTIGAFDLTKGENGNLPAITLSSGYTMPVLGLGTYSLHGDECINAILSAIEFGHRKFDTAIFYGKWCASLHLIVEKNMIGINS